MECHTAEMRERLDDAGAVTRFAKDGEALLKDDPCLGVRVLSRSNLTEIDQRNRARPPIADTSAQRPPFFQPGASGSHVARPEADEPGADELPRQAPLVAD